MRETSIYLTFGKPLLDRTVAVCGLTFLLPLFLLITALIKLSSPGPALFKQQRIGKNFKPFTLLKFRTMKQSDDQKGPEITKSGDKRITGVGTFLRRYKLDELPQLFNVFKGDMSLVGPRPEMEKYVNLFKDDYKQLLHIKPGITDYASLQYRDEETVLAKFQDMEQGYINEVLPTKIALAKKYVSKISLLEDLKIICQTLSVIKFTKSPY